MKETSATTFIANLVSLRSQKTASFLSRSSVLFAIVLLASAPAGTASDKSDYEEAIRLEALGHYGEAARLLREVQRHRPNDAYVLAELANAYMNNYNDVGEGVDKAEKCLLRAIQLDPECGKAYSRLAECRDSKGDFITGIKYATKAITCKKPENDALRERAGALSNLKRDKEALADFDLFLKRVMIVERKHLLQRGSILENLKQYDRALAEYRKLLKQKYEDQVVYREVACLRAMNKPDDALRSLNTLIAHNKQDDSAYLTRARLYESLGKHQEAVSDYSKAYEFQPSTTALKERALVYDKMGRKDLAQKDRKEAGRL